ncbi:AAA family ATPase, partial [Thomasclavelia cocleata]
MQLFKRENYLKKIRGLYDAVDIIKVITGVRRCGKSSLMLTIADELVDRGVSEDNIIYIDLDKHGYRNIKSADQLDALIEEKTMDIKGT